MTDPLGPLLELPGVADAVSTSRTAVDALLANRVLRKRSSDVTAESSLRGAWASAWLAGAQLPLGKVRTGGVDNPVLQGTLRAYAEIGVLADVWRRAPRQVLARLHTLAAADLVEDAALGRPTRLAAVRLDTLAEVLAATTAPAVVIAAIVHAEILSLDAFGPGSGVVARAAERLTLIDRGLDVKSLVIFEVGHRDLQPAYDEAIAAYATGTRAGIAQWIAHCAEAIVVGAGEASAICDAITG
jgi:hypothetical protein